MSSEALSILSLLVCFAFIGVLFRYYGCVGLFAYNAIAVVVANIQLIRFAPFQLFSEPLALGTIVFSTTFLVSDILTECYGPRKARQTIGLCFLAQGFVTLTMVLTLAHPLPESSAFLSPHQALSIVFHPSMRFLLSSGIAFTISQLFDIVFFSYLKKIWSGRFLWLRQNVSMMISGGIDHLIFSVCAWIIFSPTPLSIEFLLSGVIPGAIYLRLCVHLLSTPVMYGVIGLYNKHIKPYEGIGREERI